MNDPRQNGGYPRQQYDPRVAGAAAQQRKVKKPATKGTVVALTILITFIMLLIFSAGLIYVSMMRSASEQATYAQMLSDAEKEVMEASANVSFSPADSVKKKVLSPSASLKVVKKANATDDVANANVNTLAVNTNATANNTSSNVNLNESGNTNSNGNGNANNANANNGNGNANANNTNSNGNDNSNANNATTNNTQGTVVQQQADDEGNVTYGSGVVLSQNNDKYYIITNEHVVRSAEKITVTVDGTEYVGEVTGSDAVTDLAVVVITAKNLTCAEVESGRELPTAGDFTMSVGNPYGFNDSLSVGYVSATGRNIEYTKGQTDVLYANLIQTDSPVNAGCSGGGLYDATGTLIGINTLVAGDTAHTETLGYAIPISYVIPIFKNLMNGNTAAHPSFGISLSNVTDEMISKYGLTSAEGALVVSTTLAGPAETAGIVANDIIISYNGEKVKDAKDMMFKIRSSYINDENEIKILREGKEMTLKIKVGSDA